MSTKKQTKKQKETLKLYHFESLRRVLLYDAYLTERQLVVQCNAHLHEARVVRFTHKILDDAIYEMLEDHEIEGNCIDGWKLIGMEVGKAKIDYRGIAPCTIVEDGRAGQGSSSPTVRNLLDGESDPMWMSY